MCQETQRGRRTGHTFECAVRKKKACRPSSQAPRRANHAFGQPTLPAKPHHHLKRAQPARQTAHRPLNASATASCAAAPAAARQAAAALARASAAPWLARSACGLTSVACSSAGAPSRPGSWALLRAASPHQLRLVCTSGALLSALSACAAHLSPPPAPLSRAPRRPAHGL
jgi:hypothetical protein